MKAKIKRHDYVEGVYVYLNTKYSRHLSNKEIIVKEQGDVIKIREATIDEVKSIKCCSISKNLLKFYLPTLNYNEWIGEHDVEIDSDYIYIIKN